jgi:hypothetical protein
MGCPIGFHDEIITLPSGSIGAHCVPDIGTPDTSSVEGFYDLQRKIRQAEADALAIKDKIIAVGDAIKTEREKLYPRMEEVPGPPLNVPSRANQKANIFNKNFDPKIRKLIVLLIAGFLLFLAAINYD